MPTAPGGLQASAGRQSVGTDADRDQAGQAGLAADLGDQLQGLVAGPLEIVEQQQGGWPGGCNPPQHAPDQHAEPAIGQPDGSRRVLPELCQGRDQAGHQRHPAAGHGEQAATSWAFRAPWQLLFQGVLVAGRRFDIGLPEAYRQTMVDFRNA